VTAGAAVCAFAAPAGATVPLVSGDAFHYASTYESTVDEPGVAPVHSAAKGTFSVAVSGGASFAGRANLIKLHFYNLTSAQDQYVGFNQLAGGRTEERLYGSSSKGGTGITTETIPFGSIQNEYPEAQGRAWSPAADSMTLNQFAGPKSPDNFTENAFADGSYHWSEYLSFTTGIVRGTGSLAADGSAKLTSSLPGYNTGTTTYGTPLARKGGFAIPVTSQGFNQLPAPPAKPHTVDVPDWYPGNALVPRPLLLQTETNNGRVVTPPACGLRAGLKAFDLHETTRSLDPLVGSVWVTTTDEFDMAVFGDVCTISKTVFAAYENTITGNLLDNGTSTWVAVLTGVSGPRPSAEPFSLDVSSPAEFAASYVPVHTGVSGP